MAMKEQICDQKGAQMFLCPKHTSLNMKWQHYLIKQCHYCLMYASSEDCLWLVPLALARSSATLRLE